METNVFIQYGKYSIYPVWKVLIQFQTVTNESNYNDRTSEYFIRDGQSD